MSARHLLQPRQAPFSRAEQKRMAREAELHQLQQQVEAFARDTGIFPEIATVPNAAKKSGNASDFGDLDPLDSRVSSGDAQRDVGVVPVLQSGPEFTDPKALRVGIRKDDESDEAFFAREKAAAQARAKEQAAQCDSLHDWREKIDLPKQWEEVEPLIPGLLKAVEEKEARPIAFLRERESMHQFHHYMDRDNRAKLALIAFEHPKQVLEYFNAEPKEPNGLWLDERMLKDAARDNNGNPLPPTDPRYDMLRVARVAEEMREVQSRPNRMSKQSAVEVATILTAQYCALDTPQARREFALQTPTRAMVAFRVITAKEGWCSNKDSRDLIAEICTCYAPEFENFTKLINAAMAKADTPSAQIQARQTERTGVMSAADRESLGLRE